MCDVKRLLQKLKYLLLRIIKRAFSVKKPFLNNLVGLVYFKNNFNKTRTKRNVSRFSEYSYKVVL